MIAVWGCIFALALDLFDKFERRYVVDLMRYQMLPDRWAAWGLIDPGQSTRWVRYFMLKLPSYSYVYRPWNDDYAMCQATLLWKSRIGWQLVYR